MKHSPQWYMALAEIQDAERELAEEEVVSAS
jgi:hypothetical protein